jgi:hypothetical protein
VGYVSSSGKPGSFTGPYEDASGNVVDPNAGPGGGINNDDNGYGCANGRIFSRPLAMTNRDETAADSVTNPNINNTFDFAIFRPLSLGNLVWNDLDDDGVFDAGELPIPNVQVNLYFDANNDGLLDLGEFATPLVTTTTNAQGLYLFQALGAGNYVVELDGMNFQAGMPLQGYVSSNDAWTGLFGAYEPGPDPDAASANLDNDDNGSKVGNAIRSAPVTLRVDTEPAGETPDNDAKTLDKDENLTVDFGVYKTYSLGNRVWIDTNGNGKLDSVESGVANVAVRVLLSDSNALIAETATDAMGYYRFDLLRAGNYVVELAPSNFFSNVGKSHALEGYVGCGIEEADPNANGDSNDNGLRTAPNISTGVRSGVVVIAGNGIEPTQETDLVSGTNPQGAEDAFGNMTVDFCFYKLASLGNRAWFDANKNGKQDTSERSIAGVTVTLKGPSGSVLFTTTTDANGLYTFTSLVPGSYQVCFALPPGNAFTQKGSDSSGTDDSNADPNTGCTSLVALASGENNPTLDVGVVPVQPQAVTLAQFVARPNGSAIVIEWQTGAELNTFGYMLYRAERNERASAMLVTGEIIAARGAGAVYKFTDASADPAKRYFYWLVEIETTGSQNEHGPIIASSVAAPNGEVVVQANPVVAAGGANEVVANPIVNTDAGTNSTQPEQQRVAVLAQPVAAAQAEAALQTSSSPAAKVPTPPQPAMPNTQADDIAHAAPSVVSAAVAAPVEVDIANSNAPVVDKAQAAEARVVEAQVDASTADVSTVDASTQRVVERREAASASNAGLQIGWLVAGVVGLLGLLGSAALALWVVQGRWRRK